MFIKSFKKIMRGGNKYKKSYDNKYKKRNKKRQCYECGEVGHYIADCPNKKNEGKKEWKKDKYNTRARGTRRRSIKAMLMLVKSGTRKMRAQAWKIKG